MGKYHFIAIGGIGMSGLAKYLLEDGHTVTGSDIQDSKYIDALRVLGADVNIGHNEDNLSDDVDTVIDSGSRLQHSYDSEDDEDCNRCHESREVKGISTGAAAGIAAGSTVAVGVGGFYLFWFVIKKKRLADLIEGLTNLIKKK